MTNKRTALLILFLSFGVACAFSQNGTTSLKSNWTSEGPFAQKVFVENKGQFNGKDELDNSDIRFGIRDAGAWMYFTPKGLTYQYVENHGMTEEQRERAEKRAHATGKIKPA